MIKEKIARGKKFSEVAGTNGMTWWRYEGWEPIAEYADPNTDWVIEGRAVTHVPGLAVVPGDDPTTDGYLYYLDDHLGSVRGVLDGAGAVVAGYDYQPYGAVRVALGMQLNRGYTGHFWDAHVGQYHTAFRFYSTSSNRWLTRDPLGFVDGMNLYGYVRANPVMYMDPLGLVSWCLWAGIGMIVGGATVGTLTAGAATPLAGAMFYSGWGMFAAGAALAIYDVWPSARKHASPERTRRRSRADVISDLSEPGRGPNDERPEPGSGRGNGGDDDYDDSGGICG